MPISTKEKGNTTKPQTKSTKIVFFYQQLQQKRDRRTTRLSPQANII